MKKLFALLILFLSSPAFAADCFVSYYGYIGRSSDGRDVQVPREPAISTEKVTFTTTSTQSGPFPSGTQFVAVVCNAGVTHLAVGSNPTATTNHPYIAADLWFFFSVSQGGLRIAFRTP